MKKENTTTTTTVPEKPGVFKRIFTRIDAAMKAKADAKASEGCCCSQDSDAKDKGGKCC